MLISTRHRIQLAAVAVRPDAGERLAGLDVLLACPRVPHVSALSRQSLSERAFLLHRTFWGLLSHFPSQRNPGPLSFLL